MQVLSPKVKFSFLAACAILSSFAATRLAAQDPPATGNAESLAAAEIAFARESVEKGMRSAFLNALSDDSIVFAPGPQNGKKVWQAKPDSESVLQWQPILAFAATGGDLGYTTGPWTFKKKATDEKPTAFGQFVSVWRWEAGKWKVLFDLGSDNPPPTEPAQELQLIDNHAPNDLAAPAQLVLLARDRTYAADRARDFAAAASDHIRLYLPGQAPAVGKEAAGEALHRAPKTIRFREAKGSVSRGGDLGFAWGECTEGEATGDYLRIWRKDRAGNWELALDLVHPR